LDKLYGDSVILRDKLKQKLNNKQKPHKRDAIAKRVKLAARTGLLKITGC